MYKAHAHTFPLQEIVLNSFFLNNTFYDTGKEKAWKFILKTDRIQLSVVRE